MHVHTLNGQASRATDPARLAQCVSAEPQRGSVCQSADLAAADVLLRVVLSHV